MEGQAVSPQTLDKIFERYGFMPLPLAFNEEWINDADEPRFPVRVSRGSQLDVRQLLLEDTRLAPFVRANGKSMQQSRHKKGSLR